MRNAASCTQPLQDRLVPVGGWITGALMRAKLALQLRRRQRARRLPAIERFSLRSLWAILAPHFAMPNFSSPPATGCRKKSVDDPQRARALAFPLRHRAPRG